MPAAKKEDVELFSALSNVDVSEHVEEKDTGKAKLKYLSWAWAWYEVRKRCPDATYSIIKNEQGLPYFVDPLMGIMVYTTVTINGETHEMWLPVMDGANNPMRLEAYTFEVKNPLFKYATFDAKTGKYLDKYKKEQPEFVTKKVEAATMFDINKTVMRCLTKNLAMFGLGLALYAGEDLFDDTEGNKGVEATNNKNDKENNKNTETTNNKSVANKENKQDNKQSEKPEVDLVAMIKQLDDYFGARTPNMTKEEKDKLLKYIESKIGMMNYRNCSDPVALKELWDDLNREPNAA